MAEYYFIGGDDKEYGPYSLEKMRELYSQNRLNNKSKVKKDEGEFQPASNLEELTSSSPQTAPLPDPETPPLPSPQTPVSPSIAIAEYYFIGGDDKEYGPYNLEQMQKLYSQKRLNDKSMVKKDGGGFQPASNLKELISSLPQTPISPTPSQSPQVPATPYATGQAHVPQQAQKPGKVQAIAIMTLVGGILATLQSIFWLLYMMIAGLATLGIACICAPVPIYQLVAGIICIIQGSKMLGANPNLAYEKAKTTGIIQIICIISCDFINLILGILVLVFLTDPQVRVSMRLPQK